MPIFNISFYGKAQSIGESPNPLRLILILLLQPKHSPQEIKQSKFVAWEQVLDASALSEHSTRRDESHKYGLFYLLRASTLPAANQDYLIVIITC